jgi:thymidylate synthase
MKQYHDSLKHILKNGEVRSDRTGTGTKGVFGYQMRFDLRHEFPAITSKRLAWRPVVAELLWFLEGSTDERRLAEILHGTRDPEKTTIWTANALNQAAALGYEVNNNTRELGPIYGGQWRSWGCDSYRSGPHTDQIESLIKNLRHDPFSRRHIINAWNVGDIPGMALPPCHALVQFHVNTKNELSCQLYQRSADMFLGIPFNIASYSLLTHIVAEIVGLKVGDFVHTLGDAHIYLNHVDQVEEQLARPDRDLPQILIPQLSSLSDVLASQVDDYKLVGYDPHPAIHGKMAV